MMNETENIIKLNVMNRRKTRKNVEISTHNPKVKGSNPFPATTKSATEIICRFFISVADFVEFRRGRGLNQRGCRGEHLPCLECFLNKRKKARVTASGVTGRGKTF